MIPIVAVRQGLDGLGAARMVATRTGWEGGHIPALSK